MTRAPAQRTAIVTGGASGIGLGISERLAADGAAVAVFDLNGAGAEEAAAKIQAAGGVARGYAVDVTDRPGIEAAVADVRVQLGRPTVLVNNAGLPGLDPFLDMPVDTWERVLRVNLTGTFHCCQVVLPDMLEEGWGRIVNISSSRIHEGTPLMTHYTAAKLGVVGLTKALAIEFAPRGITVNTIPPGYIDTPGLRTSQNEAKARNKTSSFEAGVARTPVGRAGRPEDIAAATAFLVSDEAGYITGQVIDVNGGRNT